MNKLKNYIPISIKQPIRNLFDIITKTPKYNKLTKKSLNKKDKSRFILFVTPYSGNLGDHAITEAEVAFLSDNFPNKEIVEISLEQYKFSKQEIINNILPSDIIFINGGGFLGSLWPEGDNQVRDIIKTFINNKIIVFPQTVFFEETPNKLSEIKKSVEVFTSHKNLILFVREINSYQLVKKYYPSNFKVELVPDIVTYLNYSSKEFSRNKILFCLRKDKERVPNKNIEIIENILNKKDTIISYTDTVINKKIEGRERSIPLQDKLDEFKSSKLIITDRLHGMIFCLITGTPCIAMDNSSRKISGVYNEWLKEYKYIRCIDNDEIITEKEFYNIYKELTEYASQGYNSISNRDKLSKISSKINLFLNM